MADSITELSLEGKSLMELPDKIISRCGSTLIKLDMTGNSVSSAKNFEGLVALEQLVLDKNSITALPAFPTLPRVHTLWLNNNSLTELEKVVDQIKQSFPGVTYLSMLFNPCVPNVFLDDAAGDAYQRYRYHVISKIPKLQFLDSTPVEDAERKEAAKGGHLSVARPTAVQTQVTDNKAVAPTQKLSTSPPKVATFLAKGKPRYDGTNSEGNRFIMNDDL